jgi:hypothetical protein
MKYLKDVVVFCLYPSIILYHDAVELSMLSQDPKVPRHFPGTSVILDIVVAACD